jgi:UDP-N-acetylmuramyl pentapeptide phosphotransferase/UDP-N-acetylglucosamine-1-phosphate transferase
MKWLSFNSIESNIYYKFVWAVMADIVATTSQVGTANPIPWRNNAILQWIATIWSFYSGTFPHQQTWTSTTKHTYFKTSTNFKNMFKYFFYLFTLNNINIWDAIDLLEALSVQFDTFRPLVSFVYFWSIKHIHLIGDHPVNISTKIDSNWPSGFREEE